MFIDGSWSAGAAGKTFSVINPANGEHIADVADSQPEREWEETMAKSRALTEAVAMAEAGLDGEEDA